MGVLEELNLLGEFFGDCWTVYFTTFTVPFLGTTSPFLMSLYLALLTLLVTFLNGIFGWKDDD